VDEAIACYDEAIAIDPKYAPAHFNMGQARKAKGQLDEAIACWKTASALDPGNPAAHNNLGALLFQVKRDYAGAVACFKKAVALDPKNAEPHYNLGHALSGNGQADEAIACFRRAVELDPRFANAHGALGQALLGTGRYAEARAASARALELLPEKHPMRAFVSQQLQTCEGLAKLEGRLPGLLKGEDQPASAQESLALVQMCQHKRMHAAATRFAAAAFAADAKLADDLNAGHRYNAACSAALAAALAAAGQGQNTGRPDDQERARLRQQARDWLRADLGLRTKQLESGKPADRTAVQRTMKHWQQDSDLAGIRDQAALEKLPADEQKAFTQLWADVAALLKKAEEKAR
jgi:cytochrome c-type biogenesis protein CcmH/NrfG